MSRPACRPGSTTKRADTSAERPVVEEDHFVNAWRVPVNAKLADDLAARVLHRNVREVAGVEAELLEEGSECAADRSLRPVLDLEGDAEAVSRRAEKAFGAPLGHPAVAEPHELGVRRAVAANQLRMCAHRVRGAQAAVERLEPGEGVRHPLERQRVGHHPAPVDGRRHRLAARPRQRWRSR